MTRDKDKHDLALVEEECNQTIYKLICKNKNQCLVGNPSVETRTILNSLYVFQKVQEKFCITYKYFISINYLQMYFVKILLSHAVQLNNSTPIILKSSL
jgi:hypothetical protein